ncbi:MAG: ABC transporter permease [Planctomycetota bacterium]
MRRHLGSLPIQVLAYFTLLELMLVAAILYWPNFRDNIDSLRALSGPIPALQDMLTQLEETGVVGYITGQHFFKGCNTLGCAAAVLFAVGAVAGEVHRGTLEIWLARPISRGRLLTERWVAGALALGLPIFASTATIPLLADRVDEVVDLAPMFLCAVHEWIFLLAIYSLSFLLSAVGSHPTKIALLVLFLSTFEFAIYMVKVWTQSSLFRLADIQDFVDIESARRLDWAILAPLLACIAVLYAAALFAFRRRVP